MEHLDHVESPFHFPEVGCMNEDAFVIWGYRFFKVIFRLQAEAVEIDEVRDHLDFLLDVEMFQGIFFQVLRNGCDAIRLVDGERYDRFIGWIFSHQGDIGTVERGDYRDIDSVTCQDLLGHKGCGSMRNCVVYVEEVQLFEAHHINQLAGQCRLVRCIVEQWVVPYGNFMVEKIGREEVEPSGLTVCNKVYLVTFISECFTKFCGNNTASTESRVTNNTYFHFCYLR